MINRVGCGIAHGTFRNVHHVHYVHHSFVAIESANGSANLLSSELLQFKELLSAFGILNPLQNKDLR